MLRIRTTCVLRHTILKTAPRSSKDEVVSTVTLVEDSELGLPMEAMYGDEIAARRRSGCALAEVTCFADRRKDTGRFVQVFLSLTRLLAQFAKRQGVDELLASVHPRHAAFYVRYVGFEQFAGLSRCPYAKHSPSVGLSLSFAECDKTRPRCYDDIFGKEVPSDALQPKRISLQERNLLACIRDDITGNWPQQAAH